jgi:hypothetical protein
MSSKWTKSSICNPSDGTDGGKNGALEEEDEVETC